LISAAAATTTSTHSYDSPSQHATSRQSSVNSSLLTAIPRDRQLTAINVDGPGIGAGVAAEGGSALADASSGAFRAADNVGDWTVSAKHLPGAAGRWAKFAPGVDPQVAVQEALRSEGAAFLPNATGAADSFVVRADLGYVVGSNGQTALRIVVSNDGRIITAFPVK
jgi:hypothetical protein